MKKLTLLVVAILALSFSSCEYLRLWKNAIFPPAKYDLTKGIVGTDMESYPQYIDDILKELTETGKIKSAEDAEFYAIGANVLRLDLDEVAKESKVLVKVLTNVEASAFRVFYIRCDSDHSIFGEEGSSAFVLKRDDETAATYDDYKDILFRLSDVKPLLQKIPSILKKALQESEESAFVTSWEISRNHQTKAFEIEVRTQPMVLAAQKTTFRFDAEGTLINTKKPIKL